MVVGGGMDGGGDDDEVVGGGGCEEGQGKEWNTFPRKKKKPSEKTGENMQRMSRRRMDSKHSGKVGVMTKEVKTEVSSTLEQSNI